MTYLATITSFLSSLNPLLAVVGGGLSVLIGYWVNQYVKSRANAAAAETQMDQDMDQHSGDGALSVGDEQSADAQMQDLNNQLAVIDQQQAIQAQKPKDK